MGKFGKNSANVFIGRFLKDRIRFAVNFLIAFLAILFVMLVSNAQAQVMEVRGNSTQIFDPNLLPSTANGTDYGAVGVGAGRTLSYFVVNTGLAASPDLTVSNFTISGTNSAEFSFNPVPANTSVSGDSNSMNFAVTFSPLVLGLRTATITFDYNDGTNRQFSYNIQGTGTALPDSFTITSGNNQSAAVNAAFANPLVATVLDGANNPIQGITITFAPPDQGGGPVPGATLSQTTVSTDSNGQVNINATANALTGSYQVKATLFGFAEINFELTNTSVDVTAPRVTSIIRLNPGIENTSADSLVWRITFDESVQNVDVNDFVVAGVSGGNVTLTPVSTSIYDVTVIGGDLPGLNGTVTVGFFGGQNITDFASNALANTAPTGTNGNFFTVSNAGGAPEIRVDGNASLEIVDGDTTPNTTDGTDFGNIAVPTLTSFFISNSPGTATLNLGTISITGANAGDFSIFGAPASSVPISGTTTLVIRFSPTATGLRTATITIPNNDPNENPYTFAIQGTGTGAPEIRVDGNASLEIVSGDTSPNTTDGTDFGGTFSSTIFYIANTGTLPLTLGTVTITGANASDFVITTMPASNVAVSGFSTLQIVFNTTVAGLRTATVNIPNNDSNEAPYTFAIQGTGTGAPEIRVDGKLSVEIVDGDAFPVLFDGTNLGMVDVGSSAFTNFTISNTGTLPLTLGTVTITGANAAEFNITVPPPSSIAAGSLITLQITFNPTATGLSTAIVNVPNNDLDEDPYTFGISGTGIGPPDIRITGDGPIPTPGLGSGPELTDGQTATSPATGTDFGDQAVGAPAIRFQFSLGNTGPFSVLSTAANAVTFSGPAAADFSVVGASNRTLGTNVTTGFDVTFTPTAVGARNATVTLISNDPDESPFTFNITGTGLAGAANAIVLTSGGAQSQTVNTVFAAPIVATVTDSGGNPISGTTVNFTTPNTGASSALSVTSAVTDANGQVSVTPTANAIAGAYDVTISSAGLADVNASLTNIVGAAATLSVVLGTPQSAALNAGFADNLIAKVTDAGGNPISGVTVSFAIPIAGASATLSALSVVTNVAGEASISATANGTDGTYNIIASSAGLGNVTFILTNRLGPTVEETRAVISGFMLNRANHILNNQPDLLSFLHGSNIAGGGALGILDLEGNSEGMTLAFSTSRSKIKASEAEHRIALAFGGDRSAATQEQKQIENSTNEVEIGKAGSYDIWTEIYGSNANSKNSDSRLWVGYLGAHYFATDDSLIGIMGQMDWAEETNASSNSKVDGVGWMVGPYVAGRIQDSNLSYELRAAWGRSENDVSPDGTFTDGFDTERWLLKAKLTGSHKVNEFTVTPNISVAWFEETQKAYTDTLLQAIPQQTISLGEVRFGSSVSKNIKMENGTLVTPSVGLSGIWNFDVRGNSTQNASQGFGLGVDDLHARIDAGISATNLDGTVFKLEGYYDGLGVSNYSAMGINVRFVMPLN